MENKDKFLAALSIETALSLLVILEDSISKDDIKMEIFTHLIEDGSLKRKMEGALSRHLEEIINFAELDIHQLGSCQKRFENGQKYIAGFKKEFNQTPSIKEETK